MLITTFFNMLTPHSAQEGTLFYSYTKNAIGSVLVATFVAPVYAILYFILGYYTAADVILLTGIFILCIGFLARYLSLFWTRHLIVGSLYLCILWLTYGLGGVNDAAAFWFILPPLLSIHLGGTKGGFFWGFLAICAICMLFLLKYFDSAFPISDLGFSGLFQTASIGGLAILVLFLVYLLEQKQREAVEKILNLKQELNFGKRKTEVQSQREYFNKRMETEFLATLSKLKPEFLASMTHEFRTPLNDIIGFTEVIRSGEAGNVSSEQYEYLGDILTSSYHVFQLIDKILEAAAIASETMVAVSETINFDEVVVEVKNSFKIFFEKKHITFTMEVTQPFIPVIMDPKKLKQVIYNYLSNAIKFTPEGGKIEIRIFPYEKKQFKLEVEDSGPGIEPDEIKYLFMPFWQAAPSLLKKYPIGRLTLTRKIVEDQGGFVDVKSIPGKGSIFSAIFPCQPLNPKGI